MGTTTARASREQAKHDYDAYLAGCPSHNLLGRLSDKWVSLVLIALDDGPRRYSEIGRLIAGVSQKMLTQTLRTLERDGLIDRTVTAAVPVRVDYALTPLGASLLPILRCVKEWSEDNMDNVLAARNRYDSAPE